MARTHSRNVFDLLSEVEPIASLCPGSIRILASHCAVEALEAGGTLFKAGETDNKSIYLVSGSIQLTPSGAGSEGVRTLSADSQEAKYPVDDKQPHDSSAVAVTPAEIIRIDMDLLDKCIAEDQLAVCRTATREIAKTAVARSGGGGIFQRLLERFTGGIRVSKEELDAFALVSKIRPPLFKTIPDEDMKDLCLRMKPVSVRAGTTVIRQGEEGDYYYIVVNGTASVTRQVGEGSEPILLADLTDGETFGEEALLSNAKRNATVTMKTRGVLLRLAKRDFVELLKEPMLKWLSPIEAQESVRRGAKWMDVRPSADFQRSRLSGAISMPLHELRDRIGELDGETIYICCCDTGRLSSSAAFLLGQRGYKVAILRGGLQRLAGGAG